VVQIPPFKIYLKSAEGNIVAQTLSAMQYNTVAGKCSVTEATRGESSLMIGQTTSYKLVFKCEHRIPAVGNI